MSWQFWIDRGGTFTDIVARSARRPADHPQAAVGEPRPLPRRGGRRHPAVARRRARRADPGRPGRLREDGHDGRHQRAAGAQGRAHAAGDQSRLRRRAAHRLPEPSAPVRPRTSRCRELLYERVVEVDERVDADGVEIEALDEAEAACRVRRTRAADGIAACAIVFDARLAPSRTRSAASPPSPAKPASPRSPPATRSAR